MSLLLLFHGTARREREGRPHPRRCDRLQVLPKVLSHIRGDRAPSSAHPYSTYSTLALTSTGQREGLKALYRRCLNPKSYPYSIALFRVGEEMLKGWEEPEQQGEHAYRYSRRNSTCVLRNKVSASRFCIMALGYPSEAGITTGHISINGIEASGYQLPAGSWTELRLEKPRTDDRILEIEISNDFTFVPDEVLGNGDTRELGIGVERIWQE